MKKFTIRLFLVILSIILIEIFFKSIHIIPEYFTSVEKYHNKKIYSV